MTFHIANDRDLHPIEGEVVQAATKWKRLALNQFECVPGEGILTDMRAVRKDYFLDHDHSAYVDQWDWEQAIRPDAADASTLTVTVQTIWRVLKEAEAMLLERWPVLDSYGTLPDELEFVHAEDILAAFPDLPRKQRETMFLQEHPAVFVCGIGWPLADGLPHELRAADYDDWSTETVSVDGRPMHGLNGDILVWNAVTRRRHELMSGGVRVDAEALRRQLELSGQTELAELSLSPGDPRRTGAVVDRCRHRAIPHHDAAAAQGAPRRGERLGVAARAEGSLRCGEHPRAGLEA